MAAGAQKKGDLKDKPALFLLSELAEQKATGVLDLQGSGVTRRLYLVYGRSVRSESTRPEESVINWLVREGHLTAKKAQTYLDKARKENIALEQAIKATNKIPEPILQQATEALNSTIATASAAMTAGKFTFWQRPDLVERLGEQGLPLLTALIRATKDLPVEACETYLQPLAEHQLRATPDFSQKRVQILKEITLGPLNEPPEGQALVKDYTAAAAQELCLLLALKALETVKLPPAHQGNDSQKEILLAAQQTLPTDPEARQAAESIIKEYQRIKDLDKYSQLGLNPSASSQEVKKAFFDAARRWHSDSFSGLTLPQVAKDLLDKLFGMLNEAHSTLANQTERQEYDVFLERSAKGLPTDVEGILMAENLFRKAEAIVRRGSSRNALPLLEQAVRLNTGEPEFKVFWAWCRFEANSLTADEALNTIKKALDEQPKMPWGHLLAGRILKKRGGVDSAKNYFEQAANLDPNLAEAKKELQALQQEPKSTSRGFLGKLLGR